MRFLGAIGSSCAASAYSSSNRANAASAVILGPAKKSLFLPEKPFALSRAKSFTATVTTVRIEKQAPLGGNIFMVRGSESVAFTPAIWLKEGIRAINTSCLNGTRLPHLKLPLSPHVTVNRV